AVGERAWPAPHLSALMFYSRKCALIVRLDQRFTPAHLGSGWSPTKATDDRLGPTGRLWWSVLNQGSVTQREKLTQQLLQVAAVLAGVVDDPLEPLALGVARAVWAGRVDILHCLDRAPGVLERAGHAAGDFLARQGGVFLAALLVVGIRVHPAGGGVDRQHW